MGMPEADPYPGKEVRISPEQQRDSGFLFFKSGNQYRKAALVCADPYKDWLHAFDEAEGWATIHDPVCNLLGHAAELYLKAFLIASGMDVKALAKRPFGHDLGKLCREAVRHGFEVDPEYIEAMDSFAEDYGMAPYKFRYPDIGKRQINFFHLLLEMVDAIRGAAFPA